MIQEDDFDVDRELKKPPVSKDGDVWLLGKHRLVCGDSTKEETYVITLDGKKANNLVMLDHLLASTRRKRLQERLKTRQYGE